MPNEFAKFVSEGQTMLTAEAVFVYGGTESMLARILKGQYEAF